MCEINSQEVLELCESQGFALSGIAKAEKTSHKTKYINWLEEKKYGEMEWLNQNVDVRLDPRVLVEGAKSIICVADRYGELNEKPLDMKSGKVSRYARGKDYHNVMKRRLHLICDALKQKNPEETFRTCVDTAPLFEREFAAKAGIGAIGKHTLLIEQGIGSWILLGAIVTTAKLIPSVSEQVDPCATCTNCIDMCPTDAITPWNVDASKCISYLTIEHRGEIDSKYYSKIGKWIFGCDICQEVCPHNQNTKRSSTSQIRSDYESQVDSLNILDVLDWDEDARQKAFSGTPLKRAKFGMIRRNAVIVAGNVIAETHDSELHNKLKQISNSDENQIVKNTAVEVLKLLKS